MVLVGICCVGAGSEDRSSHLRWVSEVWIPSDPPSLLLLVVVLEAFEV